MANLTWTHSPKALQVEQQDAQGESHGLRSQDQRSTETLRSIVDNGLAHLLGVGAHHFSYSNDCWCSGNENWNEPGLWSPERSHQLDGSSFHSHSPHLSHQQGTKETPPPPSQTLSPRPPPPKKKGGPARDGNIGGLLAKTIAPVSFLG